MMLNCEGSKPLVEYISYHQFHFIQKLNKLYVLLEIDESGQLKEIAHTQ